MHHDLSIQTAKGPGLADFDRVALTEFERCLSVVRDRVRGVALRHHNGLFLSGPSGVSKTYTVQNTLKEMNVAYHFERGHLTPLGLFDVFAEHRDQIIVLDDVAQVLNQAAALQILLAALGNQPEHAGTRFIRYKRHRQEHSIAFAGGLICISNLLLGPGPLLQALKSRVHYLRYDPPDEQLAALMRYIATKGWPEGHQQLTPCECSEVTEYVITESKRLHCRLDIRFLVDKAFPDFLLHREGYAETNWRDLVTSALEETVRELRHAVGAAQSRAKRLEAEEEIVRAILADYDKPKERLAAWRQRTGGKKSARAFYRRCKALRAEA